MANRELSDEWFKKAEEDFLLSADLLKQQRFIDDACFHAQQAGEKYLKGFLVYHQKEFEKVHQLESLLELCSVIDKVFLSLREEAAYLSNFYVATRYPNGGAEFSFTDAEKALASAERIKKFVMERVK